MICMPAYNEEKNIASLIKEAMKFGTEILVYDDGSSDNTYRLALEAGAKVMHSNVNKGYGVAIRSLFMNAKASDAEIMVTIDADGQHDAEQIPEVIEPILRGEADIVIGSRFINQNDTNMIPRYRRVGIRAITRITKHVSYSHITDAQSGFRAYNRKALEILDLAEEGMMISTEILNKASENKLIVKEIPVTVKYDVEDPSTQNPIMHGLDLLANAIQLLSFKKPLLFYGLPGIALLIAAAFFASSTIELFSETRYISTNMILISVGLSLIGVVLIATGAIVYTLIALFKGRIKNI
jgi:glycosyltransferase involved in cell wall biosynthesis